MPNYFFIADTHFFHSNIIKYCQRPFDSVKNMNEVMVENWNKVVQQHDHIYHLGDFAMGGPPEKVQEVFEQLNGRKYLIRGNHDDKRTKQLGWVWVKDTEMITVHKQRIWLSHYPHRTWDGVIHGVWHLFGHIHCKLSPFGLSFNVGVDAHNFKPLSFDEVKDQIKKCKEIWSGNGGANVMGRYI